MKRSALWSICGLALLIGVPTSAGAEPEPNWVKLDAKGNVRSFYGVPMTLTRAGLKRVGFKMSIGYRWPEGDKETVYKLTAEDNVEVEVEFGTNGKFYRAMTTSKNAIGPRGIRVGSRLSEVRAAWPSGRFGFGCEEGFSAIFVTNTNVLFDFDTKDAPARALQCEQVPDAEIPDLRVKDIRIESMVIGTPSPKPYDPEDYDFKESSFTGKVLKNVPVKVDVVKTKRSALRRISARLGGKALRGFVFDPSKYPDFDPYSVDVRFMSGTLYLEFRYGPYKNCTTKEDDRDSLFVFFGRRRTIVSPSLGRYGDKNFVEGSLITQRHVGKTPETTVHGCPVPTQ